MKNKLIKYILKYDTSVFLGLFSPDLVLSGNYVNRTYKRLKKDSIFSLNEIDKKTNLPIFYKLDNIINKTNQTILFVNDGDIITIDNNYNKRIKIIN